MRMSLAVELLEGVVLVLVVQVVMLVQVLGLGRGCGCSMIGHTLMSGGRAHGHGRARGLCSRSSGSLLDVTRPMC